MDKLCDAFKTRSRAAWRMIRKGHSTGVRIAEETITNLILLELSQLRELGLAVRAYSKKEESWSGADWEMWLGSISGLWLGLRVQAKVIETSDWKYRHLHYQPPKSTQFQSDTLIHSALGNSPPRLPIYLLYSYAPSGTFNSWPCGTYNREASLWGCSLISAFRIRQLRLQNKECSASAIAPSLFPWHCLVCCTAYSSGSLPERAAAYLKQSIIAVDGEAEIARTMEPTDDEVFQSGINWYRQPGPSEQVPEYVTDLVAGNESDLPPELCAVLVFREGIDPHGE